MKQLKDTLNTRHKSHSINVPVKNIPSRLLESHQADGSESLKQTSKAESESCNSVFPRSLPGSIPSNNTSHSHIEGERLSYHEQAQQQDLIPSPSQTRRTSPLRSCERPRVYQFPFQRGHFAVSHRGAERNCCCFV